LFIDVATTVGNLYKDNTYFCNTTGNYLALEEDFSFKNKQISNARNNKAGFENGNEVSVDSL
jgi:hypothetical protein